ncbi:Actin cortical patch SUR7/pH-response regulator PalI [Cordyceps fumosorosea ARSEF 2679]|uniref:Actin cortical patch SUR7/pH-response regulator PalI n=1 Tax=Cordyceps fumosorosea (strain ARSEF 2679) TaxID=1081104 RepID=A0A167NKW9_CORFA|nr:Actin cortical patch SUR7/pH-response regulator PalI [Cordyceps fumosorosea ARSEF 2679]OAA55664.1 Actin cortical patch SUR7/pH-response regulator PalI [Cordyceps fumosorosea ARSEF 2679]
MRRIATPANHHRPDAPLGLVGLILMGTSLLFLFFIILAGVSTSTPFNKTYFLRADTSGIDGAHDVSQWTYFYVCGEGNTDCGKATAALPFGHAWNSNANNVPAGIAGSHSGTNNKFYLLSRFGWVFLLLALFFGTLTFFSSFLACCGRLGSAIATFVSFFALLCHAVASSLLTATYALAQKKFKADNRSAKLGTYGLGFLWGSFAALLISVVVFSAGIRKDRSNPSAGGGRGRFWRRKSTRSYEGRRVKDEYS